MLLCLAWVATASSREGESAYAAVFLGAAVLFVGSGGGLLALGRRKGSAVALLVALLILGLPPLVAGGIWVSNLL